MSDYNLYIIPSHPFTKIPYDTLHETLVYLKNTFPADTIEIIQNENPEFIDCGENLEEIRCPICGKELSLDWWSEEMIQHASIHYENLDIITPCCKKKISLNDLYYHFPCGFACTYIRMMNPTNLIESQQIQYIEKNHAFANHFDPSTYLEYLYLQKKALILLLINASPSSFEGFYMFYYSINVSSSKKSIKFKCLIPSLSEVIGSNDTTYFG